MKRILALVLLFALAFGGCRKKETGRDETSVSPDLPEGIAAENAADFTLIGRTLWVLADGEARTVGGLERNLQFPEGYRAKFISSDGKEPVFCSEDGVLYWNGELIRLPIPEDEPKVTSFAVAGNTAVAAYAHVWTNADGTPWTDGQRLGFYNRSSGDFIPADPIWEGQARVADCDGGHVWVSNIDLFAGSAFYRYDVASMQTDAPVSMIGWGSSLGFDRMTGTLYLLYSGKDSTGNRVNSFKTIEGGTGKTGQIPVSALFDEPPVKFIFSDGILVSMSPDGTVTVMADALPDPEKDERAVTLLVISYTDPYSRPRSEAVAGRLEPIAQKAGIRLTVKELTREQLNVKLLAGDDDFDLYEVGSSVFQPSKPVWEPLEQYPSVAEQIEKMLPDAVRLCSCDGHFFGVPTTGDSDGLFLCLRETTMKKIGLTREEADRIGITDGTWTLDDYYDLAVRAKEQGCSLAPGYGLTFSEYALQTLDTERGTLNDPEGAALRKLLLHMKRMNDENLMTDRSKTPNWDDSPDVLLYHYSAYSTNTAVTAGVPLAWTPKIDGQQAEPRFLISFQYTVMNPTSRHKEAAADLLAQMLDPKGGYTQLGTGKWDLWLYKDGEKRMKTDAAKKNWETYLSLMPYFRTQIPFISEWVDYAEEELQKYLNNEQDLDYTVRRILDRAKMALEG